MRLINKLISIAAIFLILALALTPLLPVPAYADDGKNLVRETISGRPPEVKMAAVTVPENTASKSTAIATLTPSKDTAGAIQILSNVPGFDWSYGCSATSAAMLFGYYDRTGYPNMYTGPAGAGVCPLDNSVWGPGECTISASHLGKDGRVTRGHVDDYWISYGNTNPDPYISGSWTQHTPQDCTGDYMATNQSIYGNSDGSTSFRYYSSGDPLYDFTAMEPGERDLCHGLRLFAESKGYTVVTNYTQLIKGGPYTTDPTKGFTFADYCAEIDAGRPVLIWVTNHSMLGYGYDSATNLVYLHDTWDYLPHSMTWGSTYSGLRHYGVHVIQLVAVPTTPTVTNAGGATNTTTTTATLNGNLTSTGSQETTVNVYWGTTDGGTTPGSWTHNVPLGTTPAGLFSTDITGLTPYATYYYRCSATNASGTTWAGSSSSFIAATPVRLIGATDASTGTNLGDYAVWNQWSAVSSGIVTQIRVKANAAGNVKVALYADNSGSPGALLQAVNTGTPVIAGWNSIGIPATAVTSGTNYWLALISDAGNILYQASAGMPRLLMPAAYAGYNFTSTPSGLSSSPGYYSGIAGWGVIPPTAPTVTNASGATAITPTTATLNGNLTSEGGSSTTTTIYWGTADGGTTPGSWTNNVPLGTTSVGAFTTDITGLTLGNTYYYRCSATNATGTSWAGSSASFVAAVVPVQVLGPADATSGTNFGGYALFDRWAATASYNVTQIRVKANAAGNIKVALYADNADTPGALLQAVNTSTPVIAGWNTINITATPVTSGANYWLAFISDSNCVAYQTASGTTRRYKSATYSSFSFIGSPAGLLNGTGYYDGITAWGIPPGPSAPAVTNAGGATAITSTTATLNGNLTSDGGSPTAVTIYWGTADGGTTPGSWAHNVPLGTTPVGAFSTNITGLTLEITYYYRCSATNATGTSWADSSASFTATAVLARLIGATYASDGASAAGRVFWNQFTAASSGVITQFRVKCSNPGNVKVAIYTDSSGSPGTLLAAVNASTAVIAGWNNILISSISVTSGTKYWLGFISDVSCVSYQASSAIPRKSLAATYSSFTFPTNPPGLTSATGVLDGLAGWGTTELIAPTVTNASGATNIAAASATLNGNLTSDGNSTTTTTIYWGTTDGGTTTASWTNNVPLGTTAVGAFSTNITGLTLGNTYYYRCSSTNATGTSWASASSSFITTVTPVQVLGPADATAGTLPGGYALFDRWAATASYNVTQIRVKSNGAGNVKVALYADNSGSPGTLLQAVNTSTPVVAGWNTINITATPVISGTNYWLAFSSDVTCVAYQVSAETPRQYTQVTYASFSFTTMPTGLISSPGYCGGITAWGIPPGPTAPAVTNAGGATAITSTTATLNGNLTSDGGSPADVTIYWGAADGGTTPASWTNNVPLGTIPVGAFSTNLTGLTTGTIYYYRCSATNATGTSWADSSASFIPGTLIRLIGATYASDGANVANRAGWCQWAAAASGTITQFRIRCLGSGNVKVAIYPDITGTPGTLLTAVNTSTPVIAGWNNITISPTPVIAGTKYWLSFISDTACVAYQADSAIPRKYLNAAYSSFTFPAAPTGLTIATGVLDGLAGWGIPEPVAPTVTNASGATNIAPTTATLNGNLTSDGYSTTTTTIYWGAADGGTTPASWANNVPLGTTAVGAFSTPITGLATGATYYYRCSATNATGTSWAGSSASFVPSNAPVQVLGPADATSGTGLGGYAVFDRWAATASYNVTQIRVKANASGNVKVALYSDNSGSPGTLLQAVNTGTPVVAGWNTINVAATPVISGTNYWLAFISDSTCVAYQSAAGTPRQYMPAVYAGFNFTGSPTGLVNGTGYYDGITAWGIPPGPTAPTVTNAGGATAITATAATLNGNLTSDGSQATTIHVYWGAADGGINAGSWANDIDLGTLPTGAFNTSISSLTAGTTYYYRCSATNATGTSWADSSFSFIPTATVIRLIGATYASDGTIAANRAGWCQWNAAASGTITQFMVRGLGSGNVKVAIYPDNSNTPGTLLTAVNTGTPIVAGWNTISISATPVTAGAKYWLSFISDTACVAYQADSALPRKYINAAYSSFTFPTTPSGLTDQTGVLDGLAGWGVEAAAAPIVTNASGATSITTTTATLNGNLTSEGGSPTDVTIYWGAADGGTTPGSWGNNVPLGTTAIGAFSTPVTGLTTGTTYYYRCSATNATGTSWAASTASFVPGTTPVRILGPADATTGTIPGGYASFDRWAATSSGNISQIRVKANAAGNVKVALYSDNSGYPGTLLQAVNTSTPVVAGWNTINITATPVISGTNYWLAFISDSTCVAYQAAAGTPRLFQATAYAGFNFASTPPASMTSGTGYYDAVSGWGN